MMNRGSGVESYKCLWRYHSRQANGLGRCRPCGGLIFVEKANIDFKTASEKRNIT